MRERLIEFGTSKLAKECGFKEITDRCYTGAKKLMYIKITSSIRGNIPFRNTSKHPYFAVCTQTFLQKWIEETYNILVTIKFNDNNIDFPYSFNIHTNIKKPFSNRICSQNNYYSYGEALEAGLIASLKLISKEKFNEYLNVKDIDGNLININHKFKFKFKNEGFIIDLIGSFTYNLDELRYEIDVYSKEHPEYTCLYYDCDAMFDFEII